MKQSFKDNEPDQKTIDQAYRLLIRNPTVTNSSLLSLLPGEHDLSRKARKIYQASQNWENTRQELVNLLHPHVSANVAIECPPAFGWCQFEIH